MGKHCSVIETNPQVHRPNAAAQAEQKKKEVDAHFVEHKQENREKVMVLLLLATLLLLAGVRADMPVHCIKNQVLGTWDLKLSAEQTAKYPATCSHTIPDDVLTTQRLNYNFERPGFISAHTASSFTLFNYTSAELCLQEQECEPAHWTMVYDEYVFVRGMRTQTELLLGFRFQTSAATGEYMSHCDETQVGWVFTQGMHGCAVARNRERRAPHSSSPSTSIQAKLSLQDLILAKLSAPDDEEKFKHAALEVNANHNLTWTASPEVVPKYTGNSKNKKYFIKPNAHAVHKLATKEERTLERLRRRCIRYVLPKQIDWSSHALAQTKVHSQGACGSCYAVAALDAFTSRLQLKLNTTELRLAGPEAIVQCSVENQGCDGGFPWLAARFAKLRGLVLDDGACNGGNLCSPQCNTIKARAWGYVGGSYGKSSVEDMMWSLNRDGPLTVGINAPHSLYMYSSGVYEDNEATLASLRALERTNALWEPTTHAVTLVGYTNGEWKLKNSWGADWGERGYFRLHKGRDSMAVESMAVHAVFGNTSLPGNPDFTTQVNHRLAYVPQCRKVIESMLEKELV